MKKLSSAEALHSYYNCSDAYLEHLRKRTVDQLSAYALALARVVRPGGRILDLGCGTGISTALLADRGFRVCGIDISLLFLREARETIKIPFVQADITCLPFAADSLDGIGLNAVIEHIFSVEDLLEEMIRVVRPGGYLVIYSPNLLSPFTPLKRVGRVLLGQGKLRSPFYDSVPAALLYSLECLFRLTRKRLIKGPSFEFRSPSLDEIAADFDSVFLSNQVDLEKYLVERGFQIRQLAQGQGSIGRLLAYIFPHYAGGIGIVAQKPINKVG